MSAIAIGLFCGAALLGLRFVMSRPGARGRQIDGRFRVEAGWIVTLPLLGALVALAAYRFGCLFAYRCDAVRLVPLNVPMDLFAAFICGCCLIFMKRGEINYDDQAIVIGRAFGSSETIRWSDVREVRWVGRFGEALIVWEGGRREFNYWWRGAPDFIEALRARGIEIPVRSR